MDDSPTAPLEAGAAPSEGRRGRGTPMFEQFFAVKREHPDCLLFFRMGDFYELFFEDAEKAAPVLEIVLTQRGSHGGRKVPMCGVPAHACDAYLARLTRKGFRVAICEQTETPEEARRRGSRHVVRREVVRVVTPGTLVDESLLTPESNNFLAALVRAGGETAAALVDVSTGEVETEAVAPGGLAATLERARPGEVVLPESLAADPEVAGLLAAAATVVTPLPDARFASANARRRLEEHYGVGTLDAFGELTRAEVAACGAALDYVELTQRGRLPPLHRPRRVVASEVLLIDAATRRNLEIARSLAGRREGSLLAAVDRTLTAAGARRLAADLARPLAGLDRIRARHDRVAHLVESPEKRERLREALRGAPDLARALARVTLGRGGPRDLAAVGRGLRAAARARREVEGGPANPPPAALREVVESIGDEGELCGLLERALADDPPASAREGGFVREGHRAGLDEQRALRDESRRLIAEMERRERAATGVASLRIRHNRVLGHYIEVPAGQADVLARSDGGGRFQHRQTLAGAVRFNTPDLVALADAIARAAEQALAIEQEVYAELAAAVAARAEGIGRAVRALAALDAAQGLAEIAAERGWVRPRMRDDTRFRVRGGRHPVVEEALGSGFVANDCDLGADERIWLVTGPNMAGKSTFLRQNALIVLLAQAGSFVPAAEAEIGVVDRLFSRVGAADDLARGRSTFMVEMVEAAAILNQAGERSFVILDEVGRGTATFDGLSIAWAAVEHLHAVNRCRSLFATHYHELTALAERHREIACRSLRVREWEGEVVFLYEVEAGAASRAYGIHVGRLAGLPPAVLRRAEEILAELESEGPTAPAEMLAALPLFSAAPPAAPDPVGEALDGVDPDSLSPREALELVYRLARLRGG